jgi:hypothetical protein
MYTPNVCLQLDPLFFDFLAYGALVWAVWILYASFRVKPRGILPNWEDTLPWFVVIEIAAAALGWIWT